MVIRLAPRTTRSESRILIAEDCTVVRTVICGLLENSGWTNVVSTSDFDGALQVIKSEGPFDLVLLDFNIPGMNGLDGLVRMLAESDTNPVGLISGGMPFELVETAISLGASGFIPKVLPPHQIIDAVRNMSDGHKFPADHFLDMSRQPKQRSKSMFAA